MNKNAKSTRQISWVLNEASLRTKIRLSKLKRYGLLRHFPREKGTRTDNYWHPSLLGVHCILSILRPDHSRRFVEQNKDITDFRVLHEGGNKHNSDFEDLITQIKDYIKDGQFHLIESFVNNWFVNVFREFTSRSIDISVIIP